MAKFEELTAGMQTVSDIKELVEAEIQKIETEPDSQYNDGRIIGFLDAKRILSKKFDELYQTRLQFTPNDDDHTVF